MRTRLSTGVIAAVGLLTAATASVAADLPSKAGRYSAPAAAPIFSWSGFYIGANVGYGFGNLGADTSIAGNLFVPDSTVGLGTSVKGFIYGAQLGYNWQTGQYVYGIEADYQIANEKATSNAVCVGGGCLLTADNKIKNFATVRGRLGYTVFDRGLAYLTAGWARVSAASTVSVTAAGTTTTLIDSSSARNGWVAGLGYEQMLWDHWSAKFEYLYMSAGSTNVSLAIPAVLGGGTVTETGKITNSVIRAGINYHF